MSLKLKVDSLDSVPEAFRGEYTEIEGGGGFQLAVEDLEDTGALKRAKDHEKTEHDKTKAELARIKAAQKKIEDDAKKREEEALRNSGNVDALEKSWREKLANREAELTTQYQADVGSLTSDVTRLTVDRDAQQLAAELSVDAESIEALLPHVRSRLSVAVREGKRVTVVLDAAGQPTANTLADLAKELKSSKALARLIKGSQGSGGGAGGSGGGGGAPATGGKNRSQMSTAEKSAYVSAHGKEAFFKLPA